MDFKTFNKTVALASVGLLITASFGSAAIAATIPGTDTTDRTLTIHANAGNSTQDNAEQNKTGANNPLMNEVDPAANVTFSVTQVKPTGSAADMLGTDPSTFTTVSGGFTATGTTDAKGATTIDFGTNNDGYYLVHQVTTSGGITTMQDFIVQIPLNLTGVTTDGGWKYDVNVYPKLDMNKDTGSDKTVGDLDDGTDKQETVFAGKDVTWNLATLVSDTIRAKNDDGSYKYGTFVLNDQLDKSLAYKSITFSTGLLDVVANGGVGVYSNIKSLTLTADTDYTLSYTGADADGYGGKVVITLTNAGIDKVLAAKAAETLTADQRFVFIPNVTTTVIGTYEYGQIGNSFTGDIKNAYGVDISPTPSNPNTPPTTPPGTTTPPGEQPEVYLGAVRIKKVDSANGDVLAGAHFKIAASESDAKAGKYLQIGKDSSGKVVGVFAYGSTAPSGVTLSDYEVVSGDDGLAQFVGLSLTDFQSTGTGIDQANTHYWISETQAPKGYSLIPTPIDVKASIDPTTTQLDVDNNLGGDNIKLPFTGGQGLVALMIIGGTSIAIGATLVLRRKKSAGEA